MHMVEHDEETSRPKAGRKHKRDVVAREMKKKAQQGDDRWGIITNRHREFEKGGRERRRVLGKRLSNQVAYWRDVLGPEFEIRQSRGRVVGRYIGYGQKNEKPV